MKCATKQAAGKMLRVLLLGFFSIWPVAVIAQLASPDVLANVRFQKLRGLQGEAANTLLDAAAARGRLVYLTEKHLLIADERRPHLISWKLSLPDIAHDGTEIEYVEAPDRFYVLTSHSSLFTFRLKNYDDSTTFEATTTATISLDKPATNADAFSINWTSGLIYVSNSGQSKIDQLPTMLSYRFDPRQHEKIYFRDRYAASSIDKQQLSIPGFVPAAMSASGGEILILTSNPNQLFSWNPGTRKLAPSLPPFAPDHKVTGIAEGVSNYYFVASGPAQVAVVPKLLRVRQP